jgi:hypothetical protein
MTTQCYPLEQAVEDLQRKYGLNESLKNDLQQRLTLVIHNQQIPARDKYGNLTSTTRTYPVGSSGIYINEKDVNLWFICAHMPYMWKPQKKRGAKVQPGSLNNLVSTGELESDVRSTVKVLKKRGIDHGTKRVATELEKQSKYCDGFTWRTLEKRILAPWCK